MQETTTQYYLVRMLNLNDGHHYRRAHKCDGFGVSHTLGTLMDALDGQYLGHQLVSVNAMTKEEYDEWNSPKI